MTRKYRLPHAVATVLGCAGLATQIALLSTSTAQPIEIWSMAIASVGAAILPVLAEGFWSRSRRHALALAVPGLCLLAWIVPTVAGKLGARAEQAHLTAQAHNARHEAAQVTLLAARSVFEAAKTEQAAECRSGAGSRCRGAMATLENARKDLIWAEAAAGGEPIPMPWLPAAHATLLPIGLELTIWACLWAGLGPLLCRHPLEDQGNDPGEDLDEPEIDEEGEPPEPRPEPRQEPRPTPRRLVATQLAAHQDIVWLLASGTAIPSQEWLRRRWGVANKGTVAKWVEQAEAQGLCTRKQIGRQKMIVRAEPSLAA